MADIVDRLKAALTDRYRIERDSASTITTQPYYAPLHDHPRFQALLAKHE
jgi:hypothetical protein